MVGLRQSRGRASIPGREPVERLGEDPARACRVGTEESANRHPETNPASEHGFLGELARVAFVFVEAREVFRRRDEGDEQRAALPGRAVALQPHVGAVSGDVLDVVDQQVVRRELLAEAVGQELVGRLELGVAGPGGEEEEEEEEAFHISF